VKYRLGKTTYLNPKNYFNYKDCLRRQISKKTCSGVKKNFAEYKKAWPNKLAAQYYQDWLIGYVNEVLSELKISLKNARTNWDIIKAAAGLHYSFVSIHPFGNGNGRTTRIMSEKS
jgi:Fic family protein